MSKTYELYLHLLIQQQHSPMMSIIDKYDPQGFRDDNLFSIVEKARVLRYRSQKLSLEDSLLNRFIDEFKHNRNTFIVFLRRLTSPIAESELIDQFAIEKIILQIELDSLIIEQTNKWSETFSLNNETLQKLLNCENMADFTIQLKNYYNSQVHQIFLLDFQTLTQQQIVPVSDLYQNYYKPGSKKKIIHFNHENEISKSDQNKIKKIIQQKKPQNIRDVFQMIINQFDLLPETQFSQNNEWICEIRMKKIISKQKAQNKQQAQLLAQMHLIKILAPDVFDFILTNTNKSFQEIVAEKGRILIVATVHQSKIIPNEQVLQNLPYNYIEIEEYIKDLHNTETCSIRKFQNDVVNYLIQKYHYLGINKQLNSVASTYELSIQYTKNCIEITDNKIFTTKLRFCNARLIAQQYLINFIGNLILGEKDTAQLQNMLQFLQKIK